MDAETIPGVRPSRRWAWIALATALLLAAVVVYEVLTSRLPGRVFEGPPPPAGEAERALAAALARDVRTLATQIGERNEQRYPALLEAREHVEGRLRGAGLSPRREGYDLRGRRFDQVVADLAGVRGRPDLLIGAHYDSARGSPGGNDDASGVAVLLALAERLARRAPDASIRFVAFVNEEPPHFGRPTMGSRVFARRAAARGELPRAVIVLDSVGYFSDRAGSQRFATFWQELAFGDRGDFLAFVANQASEALLRDAIGGFRRVARIRSEGAVMNARSLGAAWSDHASFWAHGVPAILVTDTAAFRDPHYHQPTDDGRQIDFVALARVTRGLEAAIRARLERPVESGIGNARAP
ncbi:MAG TPA: M28 family peptidase [Sandaracinaceae bacterium LLY-WYZ-13_1]|nr:M28 family peptidase [Sandaracinaceae bacterium LLY-WYZ-13_1]